MSEFTYQQLNAPYRILLGPGPSNVHPRVFSAMTAPMLGHLDPYFVSVMEDTMKLLRYCFRTKNELTFPVSGDRPLPVWKRAWSIFWSRAMLP